jgi:hypothetical protein
MYPNCQTYWYRSYCPLVFPVYKIDGENVFKSCILWELFKWLNIFYDKAYCTVYHSIWNWPGPGQEFFLSEITELFDSPFEFEPTKFYCI